MTDWANVLYNLGFEFSANREEIQIRCPFHDDIHPSMAVNLRKGKFICFAGCAQGDLPYFIELYTGKKYETFELPEIRFSEEKEEHVTFELPEIKIPFTEKNYPDWIYKRGFNQQILNDWECSVSNIGSLVIPIKDIKARNVGWVCRRPKGVMPKYLYSPGLKTSRILFGAYRIKQEDLVFITEGALDTLWLWQNGFKSVAILGSHLSKYQEKILGNLRIGELVLCFDNDVAGEKIQNQAFGRLKKYFGISKIQLPNGYKDVQEIREKSLINTIIEKRSLY